MKYFFMFTILFFFTSFCGMVLYIILKELTRGTPKGFWRDLWQMPNKERVQEWIEEEDQRKRSLKHRAFFKGVKPTAIVRRARKEMRHEKKKRDKNLDAKSLVARPFSG